MARAFDDGSSQYLVYSGAVLSAVPISMACWFNSDDQTIEQTLLSIDYNSGGGGDRFSLWLDGDSFDRVMATTYQGWSSATASTSTVYTAGTWHHAAGVFAAADDRRAYIDGGSKGTNATSYTPANLDQTQIGVTYHNVRTEYMSGSIAEAAFWSAALTDAEVAALAAGASPLTIRPQSLVAHWPLIRDEDQDVVGGYDLTDANNPTIATHPPGIFGRARAQVVVPVAVAGVIGQIASVSWASVGQLAGVAEASISQVAGVAAN